MTLETMIQGDRSVASRPCRPIEAPAAELRARALRVAAVAMQHADDVDRHARHPAEAMDSLREERLLSALVPAELGGDGAELGEVAEVCYILGQACASTAMIYAMHQVKIACLVRHAGGNVWQESLQRKIAEDRKSVV